MTKMSTCYVDTLMHTSILADMTFIASAGNLIYPPYQKSVFTCNTVDRSKIIKEWNTLSTLNWFHRQSKLFTWVWPLLHANTYLETKVRFGLNGFERNTVKCLWQFLHNTSNISHCGSQANIIITIIIMNMYSDAL